MSYSKNRTLILTLLEWHYILAQISNLAWNNLRNSLQWNRLFSESRGDFV